MAMFSYKGDHNYTEAISIFGTKSIQIMGKVSCNTILLPITSTKIHVLPPKTTLNMILNVAMVNFRMTLLMNKRTNTVRDDG